MPLWLEWVIVWLIPLVIAAAILDGIREHRKYKHKWKCPFCAHFEAKANDSDIVERIANDHVIHFHPKED